LLNGEIGSGDTVTVTAENGALSFTPKSTGVKTAETRQ
jgi:hypothetical protein